MLDCNRVITAALEKDERLPELPHLFTYHSIWAHTSYHSKGFVLELLMHLYLSDFLILHDEGNDHNIFPSRCF